MKVKDIMTKNPLTVSPNTPIREIEAIFSRVPFWSIFITDASKLVGIVTKNDLKFRSIGKTPGTPVSDIMSRGVHQINPDADVNLAITTLSRLRVNSLAVVENSRLCGIVTNYDIKTRYLSANRAYDEKIQNKNEVRYMSSNTDETNSDYTPFKQNVGFWDRILHNTDPVYWKKTIKSELDGRWNIFDTGIEKLDQEYETFKKHHMEITEEEKNLEVAKDEWAESLKSLGNLLNKNTTHEKQMWEITQKTNRIRGVKIKQKFQDADVDEIQFNNMMDYIKQYPELQSKSTINRLLDDVKEKRNEVLDASKKYHASIKETNLYLNTAKKKLQKVEDELEAFEQMKKEGEEKVNKINENGVFGKIRGVLDVVTFKTAAEKEYSRLNFYEYDRKINASKNQLKLIKDDIKEYENRTFKPIVTKRFMGIE